jgi:hypothetical protein
MIRIWLVALLCAAFTVEAYPQDNPNSPRGRRDMGVHRPPPVTLPGQVGETLAPSRWGTMSNPVGRPQWGTQGTIGWPGAGSAPGHPGSR